MKHEAEEEAGDATCSHTYTRLLSPQIDASQLATRSETSTMLPAEHGIVKDPLVTISVACPFSDTEVAGGYFNLLQKQ